MKKLLFCLLFFTVCLPFFRLDAADLEKTEIRVLCHSVFAETEYELTFFSFKEDTFKGQFTLPHGAIITAYDENMDIELVSGDTFRITAPVSAPGRTVTFRCVLLQNCHSFGEKKEFQALYTLPLADFNKTPVSIQLQIRGAADIPQGGENCVFRKDGAVYTAAISSENGPLPDKLAVRYLLPGGKLTVMEKMPDGRTAFMIAGRTETVIPKDKLTKRNIVSPIIVWDASEKAGSHHKKNIEYLQKLLAMLDEASNPRAAVSDAKEEKTKDIPKIKSTIQPRLVVFREKPEAFQNFDSPEALIEYLTEEVKLSGKADPQAVMDEILKNKAGDVFFFANSGAAAQADLNYNYGTLKIHTFVPGQRQNYFFLPDLSAVTGGELILPDTETPEAAARQLRIQNLKLKSYKINGMEEQKEMEESEKRNTVFCISYNVFFLILGTLPGSGEHTLDLNFAAGNNTFSMSMLLNSDNAFPAGPFNQVFRLLRVFNQREGLELNHSRVKQNRESTDAKEIRP